MFHYAGLQCRIAGNRRLRNALHRMNLMEPPSYWITTHLWIMLGYVHHMLPIKEDKHHGWKFACEGLSHCRRMEAIG